MISIGVIGGFLSGSSGPATTYTLTEESQVSIGVFDVNNNLLREISTNETKSAGTYSPPEWDGEDNDGNDVSEQGDHFKIIAHNCQYTWKGARIGNTSEDLTGPNRHQGYTTFFKIKAIGTDLFYTKTFNENRQIIGKIALSDIQSSTPLLGTGAVGKYMAFDNNYVYYSSEDFIDSEESLTTWVYVVNRATGEQFNFAEADSLPVQGGVGVWFANYTSSLNIITGDSEYITGLARQGDFLLIARQVSWTIHILDVTDGASLSQTLEIDSPRELEPDGAGNIWLIEGTNDIKRYPVNSNGTLGTSNLTLESSADERLALAISPDGTTLAVVEGGAREQVVFYSTTTGLETGTLGQTGGYNNTSLVANDRFYITPNETRYFDTDIWNKDKNHAAVTYESDGSIWVLDTNNYRLIKFDSSLDYVDQIQYLPDPLALAVDVNDHTRVFSEWLEFELDYSQDDPVWTFKRSWGKNITDTYQSQLQRFRSVCTMSNGRTYALVDGAGNNFEVLDLQSDGIRFSGVTTNIWPTGHFRTDGSIVGFAPGVATGVTPFRIRQITRTGFDGNDPVYSSSSDLVNIDVSPLDPVYLGDAKSRPAQTDDGNWVVLNPLDNVVNGVGGNGSYHLAVINDAGDGFKVKAAKSTSTSYTGEYPTDGSFDIGNSVVGAGSTAMTFRKSILWGYHGEFWKNGYQTNHYTHLHKSGLFLSTFGTNWTQNPITGGSYQGTKTHSGVSEVFTPFAEQEGNALSPWTINHPIDTDKAILLHGGEAWHCGVHFWEISGLDAMREIKILI